MDLEQFRLTGRKQSGTFDPDSATRPELRLAPVARHGWPASHGPGRGRRPGPLKALPRVRLTPRLRFLVPWPSTAAHVRGFWGLGRPAALTPNRARSGSGPPFARFRFVPNPMVHSREAVDLFFFPRVLPPRSPRIP